MSGSVTRRWALRALAAGWLAALALLLSGAPAAAHATLVSSDPAEGEVLAETPDVVTLTYDEAVSLTDDSIQVFDAAGEPVESSATSKDEIVTADLPDELSAGTYVVTWRVVSADGHPISGSLTFSIGAPSETVVPPDVAPGTAAGAKADLGIAQGLGYAGLLVAAGLVVFCCLAGRRRPARARDPVPAAPDAVVGGRGRGRGRRTRRTARGQLSAGPRHRGAHRPRGVRPVAGG